MDTFYGGDGAAASSGSSSGSPSSGETWLYSTVSQAPPKRPAGRTKFRETRHPVYKGVRRRGAAGRWVCEVREPNKKTRIWLGTFPTAEMAARAHDVAAMMLRGRSACLNFADSAWRLRVPPSFSSSRDIARAAAEAAEAFRPSSHSSGGGIDSYRGGAFDMINYDDMDLGYCYYSSMAEELLVEPPLYNWDDVDAGADLPLWSYSI
ncbi:hypothetical protein BHM03_00002853 [Ensete ventricosum]|uniref:AP2/ERF domain-containing protein n=1 Tax=Ensete ventricosum TaxID=4639 RepID=A0A445M9S6_ENSVE|nr:hypothetical protein BHM03_00002853 [Ensete ventricosum]